MPTALSRRATRALLFLATISTAACDDVTEPPVPVEGELTVDASAAWAFLDLATGTVITPPTSPRESNAWDIAFFSTNITLNGGAAGPAGVTGTCVCQNASATNTEVLAMTKDSEQGDFDGVTSAGAATFSSDGLTPAMTAWYTGAGAAASADPTRTFLVRLSDGTSYAKAHVTSITGGSATSAGSVTIEYAVQTSAAAAFGTTKTITLSAASSSADLNTDAHSTTATAWDIKLDGWNLLVNGGFNGPGSTAVATGTTAFDATTTAVTHPTAYRTDIYAGVFGASPWYRYNIQGDNRISPTFDVYLVKRGSVVYKVQLVNYYNAAGASRHITIRYEQIS